MTKYHVYAIGNAIVDKEFEVSDELFTEKGFEKGYMTLVDASTQQTLIDFLKTRYGLKKRASGGSAANTITAVKDPKLLVRWSTSIIFIFPVFACF